MALGQDEPVLDLRSIVEDDNYEQGLLGIAADDDEWFVYYTDLADDAVVAAYPRQGGAARTILRVAQPDVMHNGGQLAFGPDGYLFIGVGDGGPAHDPDQTGQDPSDLLGSILRIDVAGFGDFYAVPPDNPFVATEGYAPEVWAYGLRNPWRFSFDRATGDMYIADVGDGWWEEINRIPAGRQGGMNFGWSMYEGAACYAPTPSGEPGARPCDHTGITDPIAAYKRQGCAAIIGGWVYRGNRFPELQGQYLSGDFCRGEIRTLDVRSNGELRVVLKTDLPITSLAEDSEGELYVLDFAGAIHRIHHLGLFDRISRALGSSA